MSFADNSGYRDKIVEELCGMRDQEYALMQAKIIPTVNDDRIIGVRTPAHGCHCQVGRILCQHDDWTHNKAIQKSVESYRITDEQKAYLKTLKVRNSK